LQTSHIREETVLLPKTEEEVVVLDEPIRFAKTRKVLRVFSVIYAIAFLVFGFSYITMRNSVGCEGSQNITVAQGDNLTTLILVNVPDSKSTKIDIREIIDLVAERNPDSDLLSIGENVILPLECNKTFNAGWSNE
jgi:hypothetical protein